MASPTCVSHLSNQYLQLTPSMIAVQTQPTIATTQRLNGTSYAVLMIDMDIPTNTPPQTSTLLHWMQTGLTAATTATTLNTTSGSTSVFLLQNNSNTAPFASYFGPSPPARVPLSHRYVQILVDTTGTPQTSLDSLRTAAQNRSGFNADTTLRAVGLNTRVVAGNFYNVTNTTGTATGNGTGTIGGGTSSNGSIPGTNGTGTGTGTGTGGGVSVSGAYGQIAQSIPGLALFALAVLFLGV